MSQHTPGPWQIAHDDTPWTVGDAEIAVQYGEPFGPTEILFSIRDSDGDAVVYLPWRPGDTAGDQERLRANARVVATAPDLLLELRNARNVIADAMDNHIYNEADGEEPEEDCQYAAALRSIDALLTRAEAEL